ncbi:MAG: 3-hydroxyacyl-CoA dehydrogenase NAD-binding domain-containing protein [Oligoflexales bacterium]
MNAIKYHCNSQGILNLTIDLPKSKANTMDSVFRSSLGQVIDRITEDKSKIKGIIISSAKESFFAGGDLKELIEIKPDNVAEFSKTVNKLKGQLRFLETLGIPIVAAINGSALGGGLEIALACHHLICIDNEHIKLGLPEVQLGLLPGGGGIVRTTRKLGLEKALPLLIEGQQLSPKLALKIGLIEDLAKDREELLSKATKWILEHPNSQALWDREGYRVPGGVPASPKLAPMLSIAPAIVASKTKRCYPAPTAILSVAIEGLQLDFATASKIETSYFTSLASGKISKNMIGTLWFQLNTIKKFRPCESEEAFKPIKVGVIGAGMMGSGIAYACASKGITTYLKDSHLEQARKGKIFSENLLNKRISKGKSNEEKKQRILEKIIPVDNCQTFAECALVIEAVPEDRMIKNTVYKESQEYLPKTSILASNTSTLPISSLGRKVKDPSKFIGLHFFSPVQSMKLVEIIVGKETSKETLGKAFDFVLQIGKIPIIVNDSRGFFTSRVFGTYVNEGMAMLTEGQDPSVIERAASFAGFPVGPLAVSDEVSLSLMQTIKAQTKKDLSKLSLPYPAHPADEVVEYMNKIGRVGRIEGKGFYTYDQDKGKKIWDGISEQFPKQDDLAFEEIKERLLYIQAIESIRCLEEEVLTKTEDANIGSIFGFGFPPWTGGCLQYVNYIGLKKFCERACELCKRYGDRFAPPKILIEKAERNENF